MDNQEKLKRALDMFKKSQHGYRDPDAWKDHVHHFKDDHEYMEYNDTKGVRKAIKRKADGKSMWKNVELEKKTVSEEVHHLFHKGKSVETFRPGTSKKDAQEFVDSYNKQHKKNRSNMEPYEVRTMDKDVLDEQKTIGQMMTKSIEKYNQARQSEDEKKPRKQPQAILDALERVKNKTVKESEQLDELSNETLKSYKKANLQSQVDAFNKNDKNKETKRLSGATKATMRLKGVSPKTLHNMKNPMFESLLDQDQYFQLAEMVIEATLDKRKTGFYKTKAGAAKDKKIIDKLVKNKTKNKD